MAAWTLRPGGLFAMSLNLAQINIMSCSSIYLFLGWGGMVSPPLVFGTVQRAKKTKPVGRLIGRAFSAVLEARLVLLLLRGLRGGGRAFLR
jgi:hypothetical protein